MYNPCQRKPTKIHGLDYKLGLGHQEEDGIGPNLHTFESRAQLGQIFTGIMGPLGRRGQAMDDVICKGWDDRPHYARDNETHQTGPQEYAVITKNVVVGGELCSEGSTEGWLTARLVPVTIT